MAPNEETTPSVRNKTVKNIAIYYLVITTLELVALAPLCYEFEFQERALEAQLANFQGDPHPGALAHALPRKVQKAKEKAAQCYVYTSFTIVKQIFNIILILGYRKNDPGMVVAWTWGYPFMHAGSSSVALCHAIIYYMFYDIVAMLSVLYFVVISMVVVWHSTTMLATLAHREDDEAEDGAKADC